MSHFSLTHTLSHTHTQVSLLTGLDESRDWNNVAVDTSFTFGTLRTTTSNMMEQIHQKLENLSSVGEYT